MTNGKITIRAMRQTDVPVLCRLLNDFIRKGGTTAYETPFDEAAFVDEFLSGEDNIVSFCALDKKGDLCGFQTLKRHDGLPQGWADIATFARTDPKVPGVGTALFLKTSAFARSQGLVAINAIIRADNTGGLTYYKKIGFVDYDIKKAVPLLSGMIVDRIMKRFDL